jgi:hypothetical protein
LRRSLDRRGLGLAGGPFALFLAEQLRSLADVPPALVAATVQLATLLSAAGAVLSLAAGRAAELADEEVRHLPRARLESGAGVLAVALLLGLGASALAWAFGAPAPPTRGCHSAPAAPE